MPDYQQTIQREVSLSGVGIHRGQSARITLKPAAPGSGVAFVRTDLPGRPAVPVNVRNISGSGRQTALAHEGVEVMTVEHLLAALNGLQVDNLTVEIDGPEVPMGDGSSLPFVALIKEAGREKQLVGRQYFRLEEPVYLTSGEGLVVALPADELKIAYLIDFDHPQLKTQCCVLSITSGVFEKEVAPARTFGFLRDALPLVKKNLIRGSGLENTVVIGDNAVISREGLRFKDEFVRHKILDLLGDLYLLDRPLRAMVVAIKAGHVIHQALVRKLQEVIHERRKDRTGLK